MAVWIGSQSRRERRVNHKEENLLWGSADPGLSPALPTEQTGEPNDEADRRRTPLDRRMDRLQPHAAQEHRRLLPLLRMTGPQGALTALLGLGESGRPLAVKLRNPSTWHLLVEGEAGSGKSELLRSALLSLALNSRNAELQVLGIDLSGNQLSVIEALPHALTDLATEAGFAAEILFWLLEEAERRVACSIKRPDLVIFIDSLDWLDDRRHAAQFRTLERIVGLGPRCGVHLVGAIETASRRLPNMGRFPGVARAVAPRPSRQAGEFELISARSRRLLHAAYLSAYDLQRAVAFVGRRGSAWMQEA